MASLKELGLTSGEPIDVSGSFDDLPKMGGFQPLLQPGTYRFELPKDLSDVWEKIEKTETRGERITAIFGQDKPLLIVQSPGKAHDGEPFSTRISNVERPRGRDKIKASDMDYLLKQLGEKQRPTTNAGYIQALMRHGGKQFTAQVEVQYSCNPKRNIWVDDGQGSTQEVEGQLGCGARYYQKDVDKGEDGKYPERIVCVGNDGACGASIRGMNQLNIG